MEQVNKPLILATVLLVAATSLAGTWMASPGKGSHAAAGGGFTPSSVFFDGVNDVITFSASAVSLPASKQLTISVWVNVTDIASNKQIFQGRNGGSGPQYKCSINNSEFVVIGTNSAPATILQIDSDSNITAGAWHHILFSVDMSSTSLRHVYIDGVEAIDGVVTYTNDTIAMDRNTMFVGNDDSAGVDFGGCMAELWVDDTYIDFSVAANRDKFYNAGDPVNLGAGGATPTGSAPDLYMKFVSGSLGVNSGADGGTGSLTGSVANGTCGAVGN